MYNIHLQYVQYIPTVYTIYTYSMYNTPTVYTIYTYSIYNIHLQYIQKFSTHEPDRAFSGLCIYSVITMATLTLLLWCLQWRTHLPNVAWRSPRQCCSRGSLRYWTPRSRTTRSADYRLERCPEGVNSTDKVIWMCTITLHHRPL